MKNAETMTGEQIRLAGLNALTHALGQDNVSCFVAQLDQADLIMPLEDYQIGLDALMKALGPVGLIRFFQHYSNGRGDYTRDRHQWLDNVDWNELAAQHIEQRAAREQHDPPAVTS